MNKKKLAVMAKKRSPSPIQPAPIKKSSEPAPPLSRSPRRERAQASRIPAASEKITAGTTVSVRTRVGKLPDGRQLMLWLSAVVVSAAEEGNLTVVYNGNFPPEDPFKTVRVAREETKKMAAAATTIATSAAALPVQQQCGGKSAVLKRVFPEAF